MNDNIRPLFPSDPADGDRDPVDTAPISWPRYPDGDREVIAFATVEARDFAADEFLDLEVRATATIGAGPTIEIGRYQVTVDQVPRLVRAINRMVSLFAEQVST